MNCASVLLLDANSIYDSGLLSAGCMEKEVMNVDGDFLRFDVIYQPEMFLSFLDFAATGVGLADTGDVVLPLTRQTNYVAGQRLLSGVLRNRYITEVESGIADGGSITAIMFRMLVKAHGGSRPDRTEGRIHTEVHRQTVIPVERNIRRVLFSCSWS